MRLALLAVLLLAGCTSPGREAYETPNTTAPSPYPPLRSAADSLAWRIVEAGGGLDAWGALPRLRFDFASVRDGAETSRRKHLWDRSTGRYRLEYPAGEDSTLVALFDVASFDPAAPDGAVYLDGLPLDPAAARAQLGEAYTRFINDTYWLLAPLKLFDPGVRRALAPDSARAGEATLALSFEGVGLTPGDRYWLTADATGRLVRWSYVLESGRGGTWAWEGPVTLPTPRGPLRLSTRKRTDGRAILTPVFPTEGLPADAFERPTPLL